MNRFFTILVAPALILLAAGCSTHRLAERTQLPRHPIHETRMTNQPAEGYVPTGVWRIRGPQNTVYLVGTCHVVEEKEIPFPSAFYAAYQDSKDIYVEYDGLSFSGQWMIVRAAPGLVRWLLANQSKFNYPKGQTLANHLSADTVKQLRAFYGADFARKQHLTPLGLLFWDELESLQGDTAGGVDDLFTLLAHRDSKRIRALDDGRVADLIIPTMDAVLAHYMRKIAERGADAVLKEALLDHPDEDTDWRHGDVSAAEKEIAEMKNDGPAIYEKLLPGRNLQWLPKITRALESERNAMVLVGAMHLFGTEGLLRLLSDAGFKPEQMYGIDRPKIKDSAPSQTTRR
ncbi:MAG TPA: TraB/GumN family protein [Verrucomicrobiae bacterium]|jgi:uncharacterized protein YbaP (TraB family)